MFRGPQLCRSRNIVLVGPTNLFATITGVASIWRTERQNQHAPLAGELCDKVGDRIAELNAVAAKLEGARVAHHRAVRRLSTGDGVVLSLDKRNRALGVKTKRLSETR